MATNNIAAAIKQIADEKNLSMEAIIGAIEAALAAAYRKEFGNKNQNIKVVFNADNGQTAVFDVKTVVENVDLEEEERLVEEQKEKKEAGDEIPEEDLIKRFNPRSEIMISEVNQDKADYKIGDIIETKLEVPDEYGRMAAQTAKQVIVQRLREAERDHIFNEYKDKEGSKRIHKSRRILYQDPATDRIFEFLTNNFDLDATSIAQVYQKRWQIETLFRQLKQNFPLKYFLGDNVNAIEIQIWLAMLANLLVSLVRSKVKKSWAFSNMVSVIRQQLMNYINIFQFLEDPEGAWIAANKSYKINCQGTLSSEITWTWLRSQKK